MGMQSVSAAVVCLVACATVAVGAGSAYGAYGTPATSRYEVGVTNIVYTKDWIGRDQPRPLDTVIWYPAMAGTGTPDALGLRDADVVPRRFPWIVFSHGTCGRARESSYLTMTLASRGFIVVAPAHTGNTADDPDCAANFGDSVGNRVPDVRFIVDSMLAESTTPTSRFADRLSPDAIGMMGLSFGGYTTLAGVQAEPRFRAAVAMVPGGADVLGPVDITIPTMIIGGEVDLIVGYAESEKAYARLAGPRFLVKLLKGNHLAVTNNCAPLCIPGELPQEFAHRAVKRYVLAFFRHFLALGNTSGAGTIRPVPRTELFADPNPAPPAD